MAGNEEEPQINGSGKSVHKNMTIKRIGTSAVAGLAVLSGAFPASGKDVEEIVITATHRASALADHAGNVAIVEDVEFISADHASDILNRLPGVNIQHGSGQEHLTSIRSPVLTAGAGAGSFLYLEDGIPLRSPGFANVNGLFEAHVEQARRIEVVRGPGSALYGSNAVHGLINVLTMAPDTIDGPKFDINFGTHDLGSVKLAVPFPGNVHNGILNLTLKRDDGYRNDNGYDQQKATVRTDWKDGDNSFTFVASFNNLNQETSGFIQQDAVDFVKGREIYKDEVLAKSNPNPEAFRDATAIRTYLRWDRQLKNGLDLTVTPYFRKTEMEFLMHFLPGQALEENGHKSFGVQSRVYKEDAGSHLIVAGVDVEYTDGFLSEVQDGPDAFSFVTGTHYDYSVKAWLVSPYVHSEWDFGEKTRVTAGLRVDFTTYDYDNKTDTNLAPLERYQRPADRSDEFTTATPKLGITHRVTDELTLFGLYARGQRAPQTTDVYRLQFNQLAGDAEPEIMDSIEAGLRGSAGVVRFELAGYFMRKENFFFRDSNGDNVSDGKTEHIGVELGFVADLHETIDLSGSLTYAEHTYAFDNEIGIGSTENIQDGEDIDTAPKFLANVRLGWKPIEQVRAELEWVHMDEYFTDGANLHKYEGHDLFNLRASYQVNDLLSVYGRVLNIADTAYADRADFARGAHRYFPGDERFFSVGLAVTL